MELKNVPGANLDDQVQELSDSERRDAEYEAWCHYQDMMKEQLLVLWNVETLEELEMLGHDW